MGEGRWPMGDRRLKAGGRSLDLDLKPKMHIKYDIFFNGHVLLLSCFFSLVNVVDVEQNKSYLLPSISQLQFCMSHRPTPTCYFPPFEV
jgi:hypothetical protein